MPELPDIEVYIATLRHTLAGRRLEHVRIRNPFLVRSIAVLPSAAEGQVVTELRRIGKRVAIGFALLAVLVLMPPVLAADSTQNDSAQGFEYFERWIRPVLVQHCYQCHSGQAKAIKGELRLDSRASVRRGGKK